MKKINDVIKEIPEYTYLGYPKQINVSDIIFMILTGMNYG